MIGLIVLLVIGAYLAVSILVIIWAARFAKRKGRSPWLGGIIGALFMYLIVFWDHVPTKIMYRHYCNKEAGVWIYKTAEQWKRENPGVAETLRPYTKENRPDIIRKSDGPYNFSSKDFTNQRFAQVRREDGILPVNVFRETYEIVDTKTGEVMARFVDFRSGSGDSTRELGILNELKLLKIWLVETDCPCRDKNYTKFSVYRESIEKIGGK